jgi:hypothetical protein
MELNSFLKWIFLFLQMPQWISVELNQGHFAPTMATEFLPHCHRGSKDNATSCLSAESSKWRNNICVLKRKRTALCLQHVTVLPWVVQTHSFLLFSVPVCAITASGQTHSWLEIKIYEASLTDHHISIASFLFNVEWYRYEVYSLPGRSAV